MFNDIITVTINGKPLPIEYDKTSPPSEYMTNIGRQIRQEVNRLSIMSQYMKSIMQLSAPNNIATD